jgi:hypothetical protein
MKVTRVIGGVLLTFELVAGGHALHVPELAFTYTQAGWANARDSAAWTCAATSTCVAGLYASTAWPSERKRRPGASEAINLTESPARTR